jgi:hypothetical protein
MTQTSKYLSGEPGEFVPRKGDRTALGLSIGSLLETMIERGNKKNLLTGYCVFVVVFLMVTVTACGGEQGSTEDTDQKGQLFSEKSQGSSGEDENPKSQLFATDPFGLESGLAIVKMSHQGKGDFVVNLLSANQEETAEAPEPVEFSGDKNGGSDTEVAIALADETGSVALSRAVNVPVAGKHILDVKADGPWTVQVEQPHPSGAPEMTSFSGRDSAATPFFWLSKGLKTITLADQGGEDLGISMLDEDGNEAKYSMLDKGKGQTDSGWRAIWTTVDVPEDGIYLFDVHSDSLWTIKIAEGDQPADVEPSSSTEQGVNALIGSGTLLILLINLVFALVLVFAFRLRAT